MNEFVNIDSINQRRLGVAEVIGLLKGRAVVDKAALERRRELPDAGLGLARPNVTHGNGQGRRYRLVADHGANDFEVDQEAFLILDDLGLGRGNGQFLRRAVPAVGHDQAKVERLRRLDNGGEGIVADYVALQEIVERQQWVRHDGDGGRDEVVSDQQTGVGVGVAERAADVINRGCDRRGVPSRHDGVGGGADGAGGDNAAAVGGGEPNKQWRFDAEIRGIVLPGRVGDLESDLDALDGHIGVAVGDFESAFEGRPSEHDLLIDLDNDLGAGAGAAGNQLLEIVKLIRDVGGRVRIASLAEAQIVDGTGNLHLAEEVGGVDEVGALAGGHIGRGEDARVPIVDRPIPAIDKLVGLIHGDQ